MGTMTGFSRLAMDSRLSMGTRASEERRRAEMHTIPAHKQTAPAKKPGQIVNRFPTQQEADKARTDYTKPGNPSTAYKPAHGGYPG